MFKPSYIFAFRVGGLLSIIVGCGILFFVYMRS